MTSRKPAQTELRRRPVVQIPHSAHRRGAPDGAHLIRRLDERKHGPLRIIGRFLRAGATIPEAELWPDASWPGTPVLLEICASAERGRLDFLVWRYDGGAWREAAALRGRDSGAWHELDAILDGLVEYPVSGHEPEEALARLRGAIEAEIRVLRLAERERLLAGLYAELLFRAAGDDLRLERSA